MVTVVVDQSLSKFSYLALVPRGFQDDTSTTLQLEALKCMNNIDKIIDCNDYYIENEKKDSDNNNNNNNNNEKALSLLKVTIWNEKEDNETKQNALKELSMLQQEKEDRRNNNNNEEKQKQTEKDKKNNDMSLWFPPKCPVGSIKLSSSGRHVSVGYNNSHMEVSTSWTCTGALPGSVWIQLETNSRTISRDVIAPSRCVGPLLALISIQTDNNCLNAATSSPVSEAHIYQRYQQHSLEEMTKEIKRHATSSNFSIGLISAIRVWKDAVKTRWKGILSSSDYQALQDRIHENKVRFRQSCIRFDPDDGLIKSSTSKRSRKKQSSTPSMTTTSTSNNDKESFMYSRQELCAAIIDKCGPEFVPGNASSDREGSTGTWSVNLEQFDIEFVVVILPPNPTSNNGTLAFGISLCPYSFLRSKSFASGGIPSDISMPYLGGDVLSNAIIRLRPTNAHLLLQMAEIQLADIVLDPCAGIGSIPIEAEQYTSWNKANPCVAIGGDVVLNNPKYAKVAGVLENRSRRIDRTCKIKNISSNILVAWDAAYLPMRSRCVDVVVSDLPFGQQCLSLNALNLLLPLIFRECARVLMPKTGRMVLLCGGSPKNIFTCLDKYSAKYWKKPAIRVSPVTIGGLLAWTIRIDRNELVFDDIGDQHLFLGQIRKIATKRDRIRRHCKNEYSEQQTGKRRQTIDCETKL